MKTPENVVAAVQQELTGVLDPCSVHNGTRLSFADLGMVHSIEAGPHGHVRVRLLLDDPLCLYLVDILTSVQEAALRADGVRSADVEIIGDELWSPDRLTEETRAKMNRWRIAREGRTPLSLTPASSIAPE